MGKKPSPADAVSEREDLHAAARSGHLTAVQAICGGNPLAVNSRDRHSRTPLHLAAWSGHAELVSYLCKNKADTGAAAMDDMGAIHFAAQKGHTEVVKIIVSSGVSVKSCNRKGMTALHYAAQGSNVDLVKYLLKKGANKNSKNKAGKSAVDLAGTKEIRKLMVEYEKIETKVSPVKGSDGIAAKDGGERDEEGMDETLKRKSEEDIDGNQRRPKKLKVPLSHLLAADDEQVEEEEYLQWFLSPSRRRSPTTPSPPSAAPPPSKLHRPQPHSSKLPNSSPRPSNAPPSPPSTTNLSRPPRRRNPSFSTSPCRRVSLRPPPCAVRRPTRWGFYSRRESYFWGATSMISSPTLLSASCFCWMLRIRIRTFECSSIQSVAPSVLQWPSTTLSV